MKKLLCIIFVFSVIDNAYAQEQSIIERQQLWTEFKANAGASWIVSRNTTTGVPNILYNGLTKAYSGEPESMARQFLTEYRELFSMKEGVSDLEFVRTQTNRGVHHITFQQTYKGIPVHEGQYKVHILENGKVNMANGSYYPNIEISVVPTLSEQDVVTYALDSIENTQELSSSFAEPVLIIYPTDKAGFKLAYKTNNTKSNEGYIIDAHSGEILKRNRLISSSVKKKDSNLKSDSSVLSTNMEISNKKNSTLNSTVTGTGRVIPKHPGLNGSDVEEDLNRLESTGDNLTGTYVEVLNDAGSEVSPTNSLTNAYLYYSYIDDVDEDAQPEFDEVNLYYHVDKFRADFIENIDDGGLSFTQITAHAHSNNKCQGGANNACFDPSTGNIHFGDGDGGTDYFPFAWEDKVIYHEYTHAVSYEILQVLHNGSNEAGAISEGFSDYMAGTFTNRKMITEYAVPTEARDMSSPFYDTYSAYLSSGKAPHDGGEFFSSILWDIRSDAGITADETDILVYDALYYLDSNPNFEEFLIAMITADYATYSGDHSDIILSAFEDKGIDLSYTTKSGTISSNTTWSGIIEVTGNITVASSATLTISSGSIIYVNDGYSFTVNGDLIADGVIFTAKNNTWNGITFVSGSDGYIKNSTIEKVHSYGGAALRIFTNNHMDIYNNIIQDLTGAASGINLINADNVYIYDNRIENTTNHGIYASNSDARIFDNVIKNHKNAGIQSISYSSVLLSAVSLYNYVGENTILGGKYGLQVVGLAYLNAGNSSSFGSQNRIANQNGTGWAHIYSSSSYSNYAKYNYYKPYNGSGGVAPTISGSGVIYSSPWLTSDPDPSVGFKVIPIKDESMLSEDQQVLEEAIMHRLYIRYPEAEKLLTTLIKESESADIISQALFEYAWVAQHSENESYLQKLVEHEQHFIGTVNEATSKVFLAKVYYSQKEYDKALRLLDKVIEKFPETKDTESATIFASYIAKDAGYEERALGYYQQAKTSRSKAVEIQGDLPELEYYLNNVTNSPALEELDTNERSSKREQLTLSNYPNPFNPTTNIRFTILAESQVNLKVFDILGREVAELINEIRLAGEYSVDFDASRLSSGVYIYQLKVGNEVINKKMTLLK